MNKIILQQIASVAKNATGQIKLSDLTKMIGGNNPRGTATRVKFAYQFFFKNGDKKTAALIADTFVNRYGEYAYQR